MMLDLQKTDTSGRELQERLDSVRITANKNKVPADPRSASETSGLRLGTPASTSRGFTEGDMVEVADLITLAFRDVEKKPRRDPRPRGRALQKISHLHRLIHNYHQNRAWNTGSGGPWL
jgi:glycine/serine hydroxymethyltransferase